jgi:hypothetical protein
MPNAESCRERSEECKPKADAVSDVRDRAKWLKLADDWLPLARFRFEGTLEHLVRKPRLEARGGAQLAPRQKIKGCVSSTARGVLIGQP